jgi:hypothetical protein
LKSAWVGHGAMLERSLAIDERILRELLLGKVRRALIPHALVRALEVALGVVVLAAAAPVLAAHGGEPRYVLVGGALYLFAVGMTAFSAWLFVHGRRMDYGGAVTALRRDFERLRIVEYRAFKWAFLGGVLFWLPALLVRFEAATGVDGLARIDGAYLAANLVLGAAVLAAGLILSRRYVERADLGPFARRFVDALSPRGLRIATAHLDELARFQREEPADGGAGG